MSGITVLAAGPCDTIQDRGRQGLLAQGFSPSGSMDQRSAFIGNRLVGNAASCAVLEYAYMGPTLRFDQDATICLTGAPFSATRSGEALEPYCTHRVHAGDVVCCGRAQAGVYGYLAVAGGIAVPPVLGSRSTSVRYGIGGLEGRRLRPGDQVPLTAAPHRRASLPSHDAYFAWHSAAQPCWIRVVVANATEQPRWPSLFDGPFTVDAASDRMGLRLRGTHALPPATADLTSEALALGTIQVPASGNPIVAMADRQTTGGYCKAGVVAGVDLPRLAQCRPGTTVRFEPINVETAQRMLCRDARYLQNLDVLSS